MLSVASAFRFERDTIIRLNPLLFLFQYSIRQSSGPQSLGMYGVTSALVASLLLTHLPASWVSMLNAKHSPNFLGGAQFKKMIDGPKFFWLALFPSHVFRR